MGFTAKKWCLVIGTAIAVVAGGVSCRTNPTVDSNSLQISTVEPDDPRPTKTVPASVTQLKTDADSGAVPNRLINEKSPYLLQHAYNPVDWYPWGEEAFDKARQENKPIFLSIGYSTCHWCHVMEVESFENSEVAQLLNDTFVSIKVDREERPDIDSYYMNVAAVLAGSGGWPLNIFMTPDQKPFYAGTYIPRESQFGRVGMLELIPQVKLAWLKNDQDLLNTADQVNQLVTQALTSSAGGELAQDEALLQAAYQELVYGYDEQNGGFGLAPKFPSAHQLLFLLRYWHRTGDEAALQMVETTLQAMHRGGIYDQIGFGFHRYSTDAEWLVPHFEKMLPDQALLAMAYTEAYQATGKQEYEQVAREIFTYVLRDLTNAEGGFYAAQDADTEGQEGEYYLWTADEISQVLSKEDADMIIRAFGILDNGNFSDAVTGEPTSKNILHLSQPLPELAAQLNISLPELTTRLESARQQLFEARQARIPPQRDDKILADWNGLMIAALARGGQVFAEDTYTIAAQEASDFVLENMRDDSGRPYHRYRDGEAALQANLDDYAFLIWGFLELYETTFDIRHLQSALNLTDEVIAHFWDDDDRGFYFTPDDGESVLERQKLVHDGTIPSGNSAMMLNLIRLGRLTANPEFDEIAAEIGDAFAGYITEQPSAYSHLMSALDFGIGPSYEVVIVGDDDSEDTQTMLAALYSTYVPNKIVMLLAPKGSSEIRRLAEYTQYYSSHDGQATAYVCQNFYCKMPTTDVDQMLAYLDK